MCFPLTYLFNTRSGRDAKLFTLEPNIRTELKWFVNAGAESGLGVSVTGVDKHDTTHSSLGAVFWGGPQGMEVRLRSAGEGPHLRTDERMCGATTEKELRDSRARYQEASGICAVVAVAR